MEKYIPLDTQDENGDTPITDAIEDVANVIGDYIRDDITDSGSGSWDVVYDVCVDIAKNVLASFKQAIMDVDDASHGIFGGCFFSKPYAKGTPARVVRRDVRRIVQAVVNKYAGTYEAFVIKFLDDAVNGGPFSDNYEALTYLAGCVQASSREEALSKRESTTYGRTDTSTAFFDAYEGTSAGLENGNKTTAGGKDERTSSDTNTGQTWESSGKTIAEMTKGVEGARSMAKLLWRGLESAFILDDDELDEWEKAPADGWIGG